MSADAATRVAPLVSTKVYEALREGIVRGRYPQGSRLVEQALAEQLGVSRVSIRESIPALVRDGFVTAAPHRGAAVSRWDERAVHELFDLRLCLEVGAARLAARRVAGGASVAPLEQAVADSAACLATGDDYALAGVATAFHQAVVDLTGNALMAQLVRGVTGRMMWLFFLTAALDPAHAHAGHADLCEVIASGDERVAEAVAYAHIERDRAPSFAALRGAVPAP